MIYVVILQRWSLTPDITILVCWCVGRVASELGIALLKHFAACFVVFNCVACCLIHASESSEQRAATYRSFYPPRNPRSKGSHFYSLSSSEADTIAMCPYCTLHRSAQTDEAISSIQIEKLLEPLLTGLCCDNNFKFNYIVNRQGYRDIATGMISKALG